MKKSLIFCTLAAALMTFAAVGEEPFGMTRSTTIKARGNINNPKSNWTVRWQIKAKQTADLKNDIQILFVGDSITHFWERDAKGFPLDSEPLQTMSAVVPDLFHCAQFEDREKWSDPFSDRRRMAKNNRSIGQLLAVVQSEEQNHIK